MSQDVVQSLMETIMWCSKRKLNETFLELAMVCLEPQIDGDDEVFNILRPLVVDCLSVDAFLRRTSIKRLSTSRGLLLFAQALTPGLYPVDHAS